MNRISRMRFAVAILAIAMLFVWAPGAHADYAVLRSGARMHIAGYLRQGANTLLYVTGGTIIVHSDDVVRFEPENFFPPASRTTPLDVPFSKQIQAAAERSGVDQNLISSVIAAESNFQARARSRKDAMGLMQLRPQTAAQLGVRNPYDPAQNISAGTLYLKKLLTRYNGNLSLALAAYNAGPGRVAQYGGVPPFHETRDYIRRVKRTFHELTKKTLAPTTNSPAPH
jgi:Transglycosylase SLT domain